MSRSRRSLMIGPLGVMWAMPAAMMAATFAVLPPPIALAAPAGNLDRFLAPMRNCTPMDGSTPFGRLARSLAEKYRNPFSPRPRPSAIDTSVRIAIPAGLSAAFGKEEVVNHGEYTAVSLPLFGSFGGLAVKALQFSFGNENGISVTSLVFAAQRTEVEHVFGAAVARGAAAGSRAGEAGQARYSAAIPEVEPARIICDWST